MMAPRDDAEVDELITRANGGDLPGMTAILTPDKAVRHRERMGPGEPKR